MSSNLVEDFNLEDSYGWFLDGIESYVDAHLEDFIEHHGVRGQKWGVRKDRSKSLIGIGPSVIESTTKTGDKITLTKKPPNKLNKTLALTSAKYAESYNKGAFFYINDKQGSKIGYGNVMLRDNNELYLNWITIKKSARGNGYASAALHSAKEFGKATGVNKMTLEVPGNAPDARHIYEKLGFKVTREADVLDSVWGGLTEMEYNFNKVNHSEINLTVDEFLEHHGVKGQKWGVRNDKGHEGQQAKTKKIAKLDKKFESNANSLNTVVQLHNRAAQLTNDHDVARINNKPQYKDKDFTRDSPLRQKYYKEHQAAFLDNVQKAASELGTNASGTKKYGVVERDDGAWDVFTKDVQHADTEPEFTIKVIYDELGHIVKLALVSTMEHSEEFITSFLEHHGIKGQRWGVRKKRGDRSSFRNAAIAKKATDESKELALLRKEHVSSLTNKQIRAINERINLEQNFSRLNPGKMNSGKKKTTEILATVGIATSVFSVATSPAAKASMNLGKKILLAKKLKTVARTLATSGPA